MAHGQPVEAFARQLDFHQLPVIFSGEFEAHHRPQFDGVLQRGSNGVRVGAVGDVDIVQNDARLRADRITLYFSGSSGAPSSGGTAQQGLGSGDIERMIAEGEVYYIRPSQDARGDRAVYDVAQDSVTFTGNVIVMSDENVIRGNTLVLNIGNRRTVIRPNAGERVRGVFVPSEGNQQNQGNRRQ